MPSLRVDVWSDIACPWCHVGKRRLEAAIARIPEPARVEVVWRSFQLDPAAPRIAEPLTYAERLARKYGCSAAEAEATIARMTAVAAADGLSFRFDRIRPGNTFDAHRLLHAARERGLQGQVKERFFRGYLSDGEAIGDPEVLARLAGEAGLDAAGVRAVLEGDLHAREVLADERQAHALGIHAVPFFVVDDRYGLSGAQPADVLHRILAKAWDELPPGPVAEGAACGPGGCR